MESSEIFSAPSMRTSPMVTRCPGATRKRTEALSAAESTAVTGTMVASA